MSNWVELPFIDGGLNESMSEHMIGENQASVFENWRYTQGGRLVSRPGTEFVYSTYNTIHSIFNWVGSTGVSRMVFQEGSTIYGGIPANQPFTTIRSGANTGTKFFAAFEGVLYAGEAGSTSSANNLKWTGSGAGSIIGGTPPALAQLCVWNYRVWGVKADATDLLYFSKVGDAEDWTSTGVSGAGFIQIGEDGTGITALAVQNEQLFIFKENEVFHIITGNPNTDTSLWRVEALIKNVGAANHNALAVVGNDLIFPSRRGITTLNTSLYAGDFAATIMSTPVNYDGNSVHGAYNHALEQYQYFTHGDVSLFGLEKKGQNIRWMKSKIRALVPATGAQLPNTPMSPYRIASDFFLGTSFGAFAGLRGVSLVVTNLHAFNGSNYRQDILGYPTTRQGSDGHWDYISGPDGECPIRKILRPKRRTFGGFARDKRTRQVVFTCMKNDREEDVTGDDMTISTIFDGNINNKKTSTIVTDVGVDTTYQTNEDSAPAYFSRSPIRTAVVGVGGVNGQMYKSIDIQIDQNVGGYQLEYLGIELDVEKPEGKATPSEGVLS